MYVLLIHFSCLLYLFICLSFCEPLSLYLSLYLLEFWSHISARRYLPDLGNLKDTLKLRWLMSFNDVCLKQEGHCQIVGLLCNQLSVKSCQFAFTCLCVSFWISFVWNCFYFDLAHCLPLSIRFLQFLLFILLNVLMLATTWILSPECGPGRYGSECKESCSRNCKGSTCHNVNGFCSMGCKDGYIGNHCDQRKL